MNGRRRAWRPAIAALAAWAGGGGVARACSVCFGPADDPMIEGTKIAILFMLGLTYLVLGGGITLAVLHYRRRARTLGPEPPPPRPARRLPEVAERAA